VDARGRLLEVPDGAVLMLHGSGVGAGALWRHAGAPLGPGMPAERGHSRPPARGCARQRPRTRHPAGAPGASPGRPARVRRARCGPLGGVGDLAAHLPVWRAGTLSLTLTMGLRAGRRRGGLGGCLRVRHARRRRAANDRVRHLRALVAHALRRRARRRAHARRVRLLPVLPARRAGRRSALSRRACAGALRAQSRSQEAPEPAPCERAAAARPATRPRPTSPRAPCAAPHAA
jgi:hypothetical protein